MGRARRVAVSQSVNVQFRPASAKQEAFINTDAFLTLFGGAAGSGKSYVGLMRFLHFVEDPNFFGYVFRKNATDMKGGGGLFQTATRMFMAYDERVTYTKQPMCIYFPSGATINFTGLDGDSGMNSIHGIEISAAMLDEATHFSEEEVMWIISRLRTKANMSPQIWLTCNPDIDSFLCRWIKDYYLFPRGTTINGELVEGRPNPSVDGDIRYYLRVGNDMVWSASKEELIKLYGHTFPKDVITGETTCNPKSFKFISATCQDNPPLLEANPDYISSLASLPRIQRERLLFGNWFAREETSGYFKRDWCEIVDRLPEKPKSRARSWDIAGTLPDEKNPDPDWTAGVLCSRGNDGYYYIEDVKRDRMRIQEVLDYISKVGFEDRDYSNVPVNITIPRDPNASGKYVALKWISDFARRGLGVRAISTVGAKSKLNRFLPFAAVAEAGLVRVVRGDWNEAFFNELESFTGERSKLHDDQVDALSDGFSKVSTNKELPALNASALVINTR